MSPLRALWNQLFAHRITGARQNSYRLNDLSPRGLPGYAAAAGTCGLNYYKGFPIEVKHESHRD